MYENIKRLYDLGKLTESGVKAALERGWITDAQYNEILDGDKQSDV